MQRDTQAIIRSLLRGVRSPAKIVSTVAFVILSLSGSIGALAGVTLRLGLRRLFGRRA